MIFRNRSFIEKLEDEPDFEKRKLIVFESLEALGIDTSNWKERRDLEPWKFDQVI